VTERDLDTQMLALFDKMRFEDEDFRRNSLQDEEIKAQHKKACERVAKLTKLPVE
jgi:hypothetical protein